MNQAVIERPTDNGSYGGELISGGAAVQQVRSQYATAVAVQRPRILANVARRIQEEAALAGEEFYYGWRAGKENVEGPSVKMAMCIARNWGNCAVDTLPVQDLPDAWVFTAAFIDLETGFTLTRQFRQAKNWAVGGRMDEERKDDMRFQIGQSKAVRNVILNAIPSSLVSRALEAAKAGVRQELELLVKNNSLAKVADRLVTALGKCGVKESAVLEKCGVVERKGLTLDHLVILRGDLNALQNGQERAEVLFPAVEEKHEPTGSVSEAREEPAPAPEAKKQPTGRKVTKKTLAALNDLAAKLGLTPVDKEELCAQAGAQTFEELPDEAAQSIVHDLAEAVRRRDEREPGVDDEPEEEPAPVPE